MVAHMLHVAAFEIRNPVAVSVLVKRDDFPLRRCAHGGCFTSGRGIRPDESSEKAVAPLCGRSIYISCASR